MACAANKLKSIRRERWWAAVGGGRSGAPAVGTNWLFAGGRSAGGSERPLNRGPFSGVQNKVTVLIIQEVWSQCSTLLQHLSSKNEAGRTAGENLKLLLPFPHPFRTTWSPVFGAFWHFLQVYSTCTVLHSWISEKLKWEIHISHTDSPRLLENKLIIDFDYFQEDFNPLRDNVATDWIQPCIHKKYTGLI